MEQIEMQIQDGVLVSYTGKEEVLEVPKGVHTIGEGACKACVSLKRVVLPEGIRYIKDFAFKGCRRLEEIEIPSSVSQIGSYAFHRCHALRKIVLPPSITELLDCVFLYCDSLREVRMPGVLHLGKQVFVNDVLLEKLEISENLCEADLCDVFTSCGMIREITFAGGETVRIPNAVEAVAGEQKLPPLVRAIAVDVLRMMELEGRCLIRFLTNLKQVEVPEGIEKLGKSCFFDKRGILSVTLPESLREIDSRAFRNCINLESVHFRGKAVEIHEDAFKNCTSLKKIRTWDGAEYTFTGLDGLSGEAIPEMVQKIYRQVMGNFRLSGTILLKYLGSESRVVVPEGVTKIAEEAFAGNEAIDRVILPKSLQEIGAEAFRDCLLLQTIPFPEGLKKIGPGAFEHCVKLIRAELPAGIREIREHTFRHCLVLREVSFPEGFVGIGEGAFYGCQGIKKIVFPESLVKIEELAFYRCSGLKEVRIPKKTMHVGSLAFAKSGVRKAWIGADGEHYEADVFGGCERLKMLILEEGVQRIPDKLAYGCEALERVVIPEGMEAVGRQALEKTPYLERIQKESGGQVGTIFFDGRKCSGVVRIPEGIEIVAGGAFYGNTEVKEVILPKSVRFIGPAAFKGCQKLQKVWVPKNIRKLEAEVFSGCQGLLEVAVTDGEEKQQELEMVCDAETRRTELPVWESIGERAFYRCRNLKFIRMEQIQKIGKEAFSGCAALKRENINHSLQIGERAFEGTPYLEVQDDIVVIGNVVVSGEACEGVVHLPEGVVGIAPYAFVGNRKITRVCLPESLLWVGEGAFFGCNGLRQMEASEGLLRLGARSFEKCGALTEVTLSVRQAEKAAFAGCRSLRKAIFPNLSILSERMFENCSSLEECHCEQAKAVQAYCFSGCSKLRDFSFSHLYVIRPYAFAGCDSLIYAKFQDGLCIREHALEDCGGLQEIILIGEQGQVQLSEYALSGCTALQKVTCQKATWELSNYREILDTHLPEMVRLLFHSAYSCFAIEGEETLVGYRGAGRKIRIPQGIRRIEAEVFRDLLTLQKVEIPDSVTYIGARAFHGTEWLKRKQRQSPLVIVHQMVLDGSTCVGEVTIPEEIRLVCGWAFAGGLGIEKIRFLSEKTKVEAYAFRNCIYLKELTLADDTCVTFTGLADREKELPELAHQAALDSLNCFKTDADNVLVECTGNISRLKIAEGITAIGEGAFADGNLLTEVFLPSTVTRIEKGAFSGCKWLQKVYGAEQVEVIGDRAFSGCQMLQLITLSDHLQQIGTRAFEHCTALEAILLPEGIEEIPAKAFYRCHSLKQVRFPSTLQKIRKEAFAFCQELWEYTIPDGVVIEERAFVGVPEGKE